MANEKVIEIVIEKHEEALEMLSREIPEYVLTYDDIIAIHEAMIDRFGGAPGIRDHGLLENVVNSPTQSVFGVDLYPSVYDKAAKYLFDFAHYQIFIDGNKRTGLACLGLFLEMNGYELNMTPEEEYEFTLDIANNRYNEVKDVAEVVKNHTSFLNHDTIVLDEQEMEEESSLDGLEEI